MYIMQCCRIIILQSFVRHRSEKNQGVFVKHYAPGGNEVQKAIFIFKVKVKNVDLLFKNFNLGHFLTCFFIRRDRASHVLSFTWYHNFLYPGNDIWWHQFFVLSVTLWQKNFNLGHNFWTMWDRLFFRNFIFGMYIQLMKPFQMTP